MLGMFIDVFLFISTHILLVQFSPDSAETNIRRGGEMACHLMASYARNIFVPKIIKIGQLFFE